MSLLKIGGKTDSNIAKALRVDNSGNAFSKRELTSSDIILFNHVQIRDTEVYYSAFSSEIFNLFAKSAIKSLRIDSTIDQPIRIDVADDYHTNRSSGYLTRMDGTPIQFWIPAYTGVARRFIITPSFIPELDYIKCINLLARCTTAPTSGEITCVAIIKS